MAAQTTFAIIIRKARNVEFSGWELSAGSWGRTSNAHTYSVLQVKSQPLFCHPCQVDRSPCRLRGFGRTTFPGRFSISVSDPHQSLVYQKRLCSSVHTRLLMAFSAKYHQQVLQHNTFTGKNIAERTKWISALKCVYPPISYIPHHVR